MVKPTVLSGSRGVIRADDAVEFHDGVRSAAPPAGSTDVRELRDPEADLVQIEEYIPGAEYALEGLLEHGALRPLAIFDKPDPLDGPFFEETIYVTPSRARAPATSAQIEDPRWPRAAALGLHHGPIHAECRVNSRGVFVLEVAARPIGGLCAKALRFERRRACSIGFEEFLLRHALGEPIGAWQREPRASAVMMIPIPRSGVYRRVDGVEAAGRGAARRGDPDHGQARSAAAAVAGGRELPGIHLCEGRHAGICRTRGARSARAAAIYDRSVIAVLHGRSMLTSLTSCCGT